MEINNNSTLQDVKQYLNNNYKDGCYCPACNQRVQLYKRKLSSTMAFCLIKFVLYTRKHGNHFKKYSDILDDQNITPTQRADWQKLAYFRLIQPNPDQSAEYKVTSNGFDFVHGNILMPQYANVMNKKVYGYAMQQITIKQALSTKFNLDDLLNGN